MPSGSNRPKSSRSSSSSGDEGATVPTKSALDILRRWGVTVDELTRLVDENPSLRGIMLGYVAEHHLSKLLTTSDQISDSLKYDDHDRTKKGDRVVRYKGQRFIIESKSLQTNHEGFGRRKVVRQGAGGRKRSAEGHLSRWDHAGNNTVAARRVRCTRRQLLRLRRHLAMGLLQKQRPPEVHVQKVHGFAASRTARVIGQCGVAANAALHRGYLQGSGCLGRREVRYFRFVVLTKTRK